MNKRITSFLLSFCIFITFFSSCLSPAALILIDEEISDGADIPTWYIGDEWTYTADPVSFSGDAGSFLGVIENFKNKVIGIKEIVHNEMEIDVYEIEISGELSGEFSFEELSGDIVGDISGFSFRRVSDLAEIKTDITSTGVATILFIDRDYELAHNSSFSPPMEVFDFPINVGEQWEISTDSESNGYYILEDLIEENYSEEYLLNAIVQCTEKQTIEVPAGSFECYNVIYGSNSIFYSSEVGNMVKSVVDEETENSTFSAVISLESYIRNNQPVSLSVNIDPQEAFIFSEATISGQAINTDTGEPIVEGNVYIGIPAIDDGWSTVTDGNGNYLKTIEVPLIFDDTPCDEEFGSVGVVVECRLGSLSGYRINTLVIIADYPPKAPVITGQTDGNVGVSYMYTFTLNDSDDDAVFLDIIWGDGTVDEWIGPYGSNSSVSIPHTWNEKGTFTIMARGIDTYGAISGYGTLTVTMPRNKAFFPHISRSIFLNFPFLQKLFDFLLS
jgi:hypothetical protein